MGSRNVCRATRFRVAGENRNFRSRHWKPSIRVGYSDLSGESPDIPSRGRSWAMSGAVGDVMRDGEPDSGSTASELLNAAKQRDAAAWQELVDRHAWLVFQWCRNAELKIQDAADVLQAVLMD